VPWQCHNNQYSCRSSSSQNFVCIWSGQYHPKTTSPLASSKSKTVLFFGSWLTHMACYICPSWYHCHSLSLASVKSRLILPFWYQLTRVVPEKGPLNVCMCVCTGLPSLSWEKPLWGIKICLWLHFYSVNKKNVVIEAVSLIWSDPVSIWSIICYLQSSCRKKTVLPTENEAIFAFAPATKVTIAISGIVIWCSRNSVNLRCLTFTGPTPKWHQSGQPNTKQWLSLQRLAFSALMLFVGQQEGPVKNWVVGCWHGYLSGARCRLAYGPADATATHCLLLQ